MTDAQNLKFEMCLVQHDKEKSLQSGKYHKHIQID